MTQCRNCHVRVLRVVMRNGHTMEVDIEQDPSGTVAIWQAGGRWYGHELEPIMPNPPEVVEARLLKGLDPDTRVRRRPHAETCPNRSKR